MHKQLQYRNLRDKCVGSYIFIKAVVIPTFAITGNEATIRNFKGRLIKLSSSIYQAKSYLIIN